MVATEDSPPSFKGDEQQSATHLDTDEFSPSAEDADNTSVAASSIGSASINAGSTHLFRAADYVNLTGDVCGVIMRKKLTANSNTTTVCVCGNPAHSCPRSKHQANQLSPSKRAPLRYYRAAEGSRNPTDRSDGIYDLATALTPDEYLQRQLADDHEMATMLGEATESNPPAAALFRKPRPAASPLGPMFLHQLPMPRFGPRQQRKRDPLLHADLPPTLPLGTD